MKPIDAIVLLREIGSNLHTIRNARKETLQAVAASINITHPVISKIENGRYDTLTLSLLIKLCNHYQVSLQQVLSLDIANIFQIINHGEGHQRLIGQELAVGYELYIQQLNNEIQHMKEQNMKLMDMLGKK